MDPAQIVNGTAAAIAAAIWLAQTPRSFASGSRLAAIAGALTFGVCGWYAAVNLALGFGVLNLEMGRTVGLFRYAFPVVVLGPAIRSRAMSNAENRMIRDLGHHA